MSSRFAFERLADVRHDAQLLIDLAGDQERQLAALVAAAEEDVRHAEAVVSHAAEHLDVEDVRHLLSAQLERSLASAAVARRLLAGGATAAGLRFVAWSRVPAVLGACRWIGRVSFRRWLARLHGSANA